MKVVGESAKAVETCVVEKAVAKMVECAVGVTYIALQSLCWVVLGAHVVYQGGNGVCESWCGESVVGCSDGCGWGGGHHVN